ncbi:MAG: helix-turn-helix transcriptional regulator [bacterium]|nr:helix-turn-helix transcriptional regulator [bacterium]
MKAKDETLRVLKRLRLLIYLLDDTLREVEKRSGFSRGYLSQILTGTVEIKLWQVLAILEAIQLEPSEFFAELFPRRCNRAVETLDELHNGSRTLERPLSLELARLFKLGIESIEDFRGRLERCEEALAELHGMGLLEDPEA